MSYYQHYQEYPTTFEMLAKPCMLLVGAGVVLAAGMAVDSDRKRIEEETRVEIVECLNGLNVLTSTVENHKMCEEAAVEKVKAD